MWDEVKTNKIAVVFVLIFVIGACLYFCFVQYQIKKDPVYVIGKIYSIEFNGDGYTYKFYYKCNGVKYNTVLVASKLFRQEDLILLRISKKDPQYWFHIKSLIPDCIVSKPDLDKYWTSFPSCQTN